MITVDEALAILARHTVDFGEEQLPLAQTMQRVIREPVHSDRPLPPYDRVTMDGIAISYTAFEKGQRSFPIDGVAAAGMPRIQLKNKNHCLEVMTGAIMPLGADTVIPYEEVELQGDVAALQTEQITRQQNIHFSSFPPFFSRSINSFSLYRRFRRSPLNSFVSTPTRSLCFFKMSCHILPFSVF